MLSAKGKAPQPVERTKRKKRMTKASQTAFHQNPCSGSLWARGRAWDNNEGQDDPSLGRWNQSIFIDPFRLMIDTGLSLDRKLGPFLGSCEPSSLALRTRSRACATPYANSSPTRFEQVLRARPLSGSGWGEPGLGRRVLLFFLTVFFLASSVVKRSAARTMASASQPRQIDADAIW